jgi:hypothetical protein
MYARISRLPLSACCTGTKKTKQKTKHPDPSHKNKRNRSSDYAVTVAVTEQPTKPSRTEPNPMNDTKVDCVASISLGRANRELATAVDGREKM